MTSPVQRHGAQDVLATSQWRCDWAVHAYVPGVLYSNGKSIKYQSIIHLLDLICTRRIRLGNFPSRVSRCHILELME